VQAVTDTVYVADVATAGAGGSCSAPNYATGVLDDDVAIQDAIDEVLADDTIDGPGTLTTVYLCPSTYHITAGLHASAELTIQGANAATTILDGGAELNVDGSWLRNGVWILYGEDGLTVSNLTFTHGHSAEGSGAIGGSGPMHIADAEFTYNSGAYGGAISNGGSVEVIRSTFIENNASNNGGAITATEIVAISSSIFSGNSALSGGAVHSNVSVTSTQSSFTDNEASEGGAIATNDIIVNRSTFTNNSADTDGGAINALSSVIATSSTFTNNSAHKDGGDGGDGGAINALSVIATSSTFTNNSANYGGAISGYDSATVTSSTFMKNSAESSGGAVITYNGIIARSRFTRNTAGEHGGAVALWDQNSDDLQQVRGNSFRGNTASGGGAIALRSCETTYTRSQVRRVERVNRFSGNRATQHRRTNNIEPWVDDCP
jgi:hypothetical protein